MKTNKYIPVNTKALNELAKQNASEFMDRLKPIVAQLVAEMGVPAEMQTAAKAMLVTESVIRLTEALAEQLAVTEFEPPKHYAGGIH